MNPEVITSVGAWLPVTPQDALAIEQLVRENNLLIPGNFRMEDTFDIVSYLYVAQRHGHNFRVLFDRNLHTRIVNLAKGQPLPTDTESSKIARHSAACLAFCILSEIEVEPSMALYEGASTQGHEHAAHEYRFFQIADNVDPQHYVDIALGRSDRLPTIHLSELGRAPEITSRVLRESNFEKTLTPWKPNYLYLLKTAQLIRNGVPRRQAAENLLRWQAEEAFYNAPASLFCLAAMGHTPPNARMIKKLFTLNTNELRKGLRNATWDVCIISQWEKWLRAPESPSWLLSSNDYALRTIAQAVFSDSDLPSDSLLLSFMQSCWGKRDGNYLFNAYNTAVKSASIGSPERHKTIQTAFANLENNIHLLEIELGMPTAAI